MSPGQPTAGSRPIGRSGSGFDDCRDFSTHSILPSLCCRPLRQEVLDDRAAAKFNGLQPDRRVARERRDVHDRLLVVPATRVCWHGAQVLPFPAASLGKDDLASAVSSILA